MSSPFELIRDEHGFSLMELIVTLALTTFLGTLVVSVLLFVNKRSASQLERLRHDGAVQFLSSAIHNDLEHGVLIEDSSYVLGVVLGLADTVTYELREGKLSRNGFELNDPLLVIDSLKISERIESTANTLLQKFVVYYQYEGGSHESHNYAIVKRQAQ